MVAWREEVREGEACGMTPGTLLSGVPGDGGSGAELEIEEDGFTFEMCSVWPVGVQVEVPLLQLDLQV